MIAIVVLTLLGFIAALSVVYGSKTLCLIDILSACIFRL